MGMKTWKISPDSTWRRDQLNTSYMGLSIAEVMAEQRRTDPRRPCLRRARWSRAPLLSAHGAAVTFNNFHTEFLSSLTGWAGGIPAEKRVKRARRAKCSERCVQQWRPVSLIPVSSQSGCCLFRHCCADCSTKHYLKTVRSETHKNLTSSRC